MKVDFTLDEDDFLEYQLYVASKSKRIKNKRRNLRVLVTLLYFVWAIWKFMQDDDILFSSLLAVFALLWFIFYPIYSKYYHKKHYKKFVQENYQERFFKPIELEINKEQIRSKDYIGEGKINPSEVEALIELRNRFFLKLNSNASLIIPKRDLKNIDDFKNAFKELNIPIKDEHNWEWK